MSADELPATILNDSNDLKVFKDFIFHDSSFEKLALQPRSQRITDIIIGRQRNGVK